ncbi:MAG TPA: hypothetical protein VN841_26765 [Bryobacteraceae bacterium]|nr:hypothetical protein [Bryobacteraceae bacterium]
MNQFLAFLGLVAASPLSWCQPTIQAVVNAATFQGGLPYGGGLATIFVSGLTGPPGTYVAPSSAPLPFVLAGVGVEVNYTLAPILAVVIPPGGQSAVAQINFQVPLERNASIRSHAPNGFPGYLTVMQPQGGGTVIRAPLEDPPFTGGFFSDGNGYAIAQHASEYSTVTVQNPAHAGETIIAYANDLYPVWPPTPIGFPVPQQPLFQFTDGSPFGTYIPSPGNLYLQEYPGQAVTPAQGIVPPNTPPLTILFQGLAPGLVGVEQINFVVPANQQPGDWPLFFDTGCPPGQISACPGGGNASPSVKLPIR